MASAKSYHRSTDSAFLAWWPCVLDECRSVGVIPSFWTCATTLGALSELAWTLPASGCQERQPFSLWRAGRLQALQLSCRSAFQPHVACYLFAVGWSCSIGTQQPLFLDESNLLEEKWLCHEGVLNLENCAALNMSRISVCLHGWDPSLPSLSTRELLNWQP